MICGFGGVRSHSLPIKSRKLYPFKLQNLLLLWFHSGTIRNSKIKSRVDYQLSYRTLVHPENFEISTQRLKDAYSASELRMLIFILVHPVGLEPTTHKLKACYSTN